MNYALALDDTEIGFFEGDGMFLADILAEQAKSCAAHGRPLCFSDCRGLYPHWRRNLNNEECRCEKNGS